MYASPPFAPIRHLQPFLQVETKVSKWEMPEELLLLLERVEQEGSGATIAYVFPTLPPIRQYLSSRRAFLDNLANHWPSQKAQVQPANLKTL